MKARKSVTALSVSGAPSCLASRRGMSAKSAAPCVTDLNGLPSNDGAEVTQKLSIGSASRSTSTPRARRIVPNLGVGLGLLLRELLEIAQHAARHALSDRGQDGTFLDHLARDVEWQVGRVHEPAHKAQIAGQYLGFVGDEDALDIKLDAAFAIDVEQVERPRAGNKRERGIFMPTLGAEMDRKVGLIELPGEAAIEVGIIRGRNVG